MNTKFLLSKILIGFSICFLVACGGGGGGSSAPEPVVTDTDGDGVAVLQMHSLMMQVKPQIAIQMA